MEEQILQLQMQLDELKRDFYKNKLSNVQYFDTPIIFRKGIDLRENTVTTGATTGSIIGASGDKVGFLGAAPVARQAHVADPSGGATTDTQARSAISSILTTLERFGFHATS